MKYKNLKGRKFSCSNFQYSMLSSASSSKGRGNYNSPTPFIVWEYKIMEIGPFKGQECVLEQYGKDNAFVYPVTELERTKQLTEKDKTYYHAQIY